MQAYSNTLTSNRISSAITPGSSMSADSATSPKMTSYILADLSCLDEFTEAIREKIMRHLVPTQVISATCPSCPCCFLEKLPIEIRNQIYGYLLINPSLSDSSSIEVDEDFGSKTAYGLSPCVILTCEQISREASQVLYESNAFFMAVSPLEVAQHYGRFPLLSPLTRFNQNTSFTAISKVRSWKIISLGGYDNGNMAIATLTRFCFAISYSKLKPLEFLICPLLQPSYWTARHGFLAFLKPFRVLRDVKSFQARDATISEVPQGLCHVGSDDIESTAAATLDTHETTRNQLRAETALLGLQTIVQGNTPVHHLGEMYNSLLHYVMAFDYHGPFDSILEERLVWSPKSTIPFESPNKSHCHCSKTEFHSFHPNGEHLLDAEYYVEKQDLVAFKGSRSKILESLEPQYKRIVAASMKLAEFIKQEKKKDGSCTSAKAESTSGWVHWTAPAAAVALVLLEDYTHAFKDRNIPSDIRANIMRHQHCDDGWSSRFDSNWTITDAPLRKEHIHFFRKFEKFKAGVDDLDSQYLMIRNARKALYAWDSPGDTGCSIRVDGPPPLCDEMVDWTCDEPELGPRYRNGDMFVYSRMAVNNS